MEEHPQDVGAALRFRGSYVWFINQEVEEQLDQLYQAVGTAGIPPNFVTYDQQGAMRIKGAPSLSTSSAAAWATWATSFWLTGHSTRSRPSAAYRRHSMHVQFLTDQMAYRFIRRVDGQPTWQSDLTPYKGTNTQSPFITLEARWSEPARSIEMLNIPEGCFPVSLTKPVTTNGGVTTDYVSLKNAVVQAWIVVHLTQAVGHATAFSPTAPPPSPRPERLCWVTLCRSGTAMSARRATHLPNRPAP